MEYHLFRPTTDGKHDFRDDTGTMQVILAVRVFFKNLIHYKLNTKMKISPASKGSNNKEFHH